MHSKLTNGIILILGDVTSKITRDPYYCLGYNPPFVKLLLLLLTLTLTLFCLISVGYHLELRIVVMLYGEYHFLPK